MLCNQDGRARSGRLQRNLRKHAGFGRWALFSGLAHTLAVKRICTGLISPQIADPHIEVSRAHAIRLMRLAHKATGPSALGLLPLVMHVYLRCSPVRPDGARS